MIIFFVILLGYAVVSELAIELRSEPDRHQQHGQNNTDSNSPRPCECNDGK